MELKKAIYTKPELSEGNLLREVQKYLGLVKPSIIAKLRYIEESEDVAEAILKEYDLIQEKKSCLSRLERDLISGYVGLCMIKMVKEDGGLNK